MDLWEILVPVAYNTGEEIGLYHHKAWDIKVRNISGGLTIMRSAQGQWIDPEGDVRVERMIPVRFALPKNSHSTVKKIMKLTADHYNQLSITCYRISDYCLILPRKEL